MTATVKGIRGTLPANMREHVERDVGPVRLLIVRLNGGGTTPSASDVYTDATACNDAAKKMQREYPSMEVIIVKEIAKVRAIPDPYEIVLSGGDE